MTVWVLYPASQILEKGIPNMLRQCEWWMRYAYGWALFHIQTNGVVIQTSRLQTRIWAYYWILAGVFKYRKRLNTACGWDRTQRVIGRAIRTVICRQKRLDQEEERRYWHRVVQLAEESGKPQWVVRDILEDSPWLVDMSLSPSRREQRRA